MRNKPSVLIEYRRQGDRFLEIWHDGKGGEAVVGTVLQPPPNARPVDPEEHAETRRFRKEEAAHEAYLKRTADPRFAEIHQRMIEKAESLEPSEYERYNSDHASFNKAYDSVRRDELEERHRARTEEIRERQHSHNARERHEADLDAMAEHERHRNAVAAVESANYEALVEEPAGEE